MNNAFFHVGNQFHAGSQISTRMRFSAATPIGTIVDGYDPVGNRIARNLDGNPITWSYDDLYRLTGQQKAGQVCTYTLDGVGNLKTMWEGGNFPRTFTHDAADRLVTMIEGSNLTTYTWTGYGALSTEITGTATTDYSYNGQDQLALVTPPGDGFPTTYAFDGDGLRRSIQTTNVNQDPPTLDITTVVWDGSDYLLLNGPDSDAVVLTLGGEIVSSGSTDLLPDSLGSVIGDIRSGQDPRVPFSYWPYGTMLLSVVQPSFPFLFVRSLGYYYDSTDRDYVRARELMKKNGRWMQVDALWPGAQAYGYALNNPVSYHDRSGLGGLMWSWIYVAPHRHVIGPPGTAPPPGSLPPPVFPPRPVPSPGPAPRPRPAPHSSPPHELPWRGIGPGGGFQYGAYCGMSNVQPSGKRILPQDCIDACCLYHDRCLEGHYGYGRSLYCAHHCCDCDLLSCVARALVSGCCRESEHPTVCSIAGEMIMTFFSFACGAFSWPLCCPPCLPPGQWGGGVRKYWEARVALA